MAVTADKMKSQKADYGQYKTAVQKRDTAAQNNINKTIDSTYNTQVQGINDAYNKNVTAQTEARTAAQKAYDVGKADVAVQANRNQRNMDRFADVRGLNRQQGSQQALQLNRAKQTAYGDMLAARQKAMDEHDRQLAMLKVNTNNLVQNALANHDYRKAAAQLDEYNNKLAFLDKSAADLMGYGNSVGYKMLYGADPAKAMQAGWNGMNPEIAYNTGKINANKYKKMTGLNPMDLIPTDTGDSGGKRKDYASYYTNGLAHYNTQSQTPNTTTNSQPHYMAQGRLVK